MSYIATQCVGEFKAGDKVTGFSKERMKTFLDEGIVFLDGNDDADDESKPISKMNVSELKDYITAHGYEVPEGDKSVLKDFAEGIEAQLEQGE